MFDGQVEGSGEQARLVEQALVSLISSSWAGSAALTNTVAGPEPAE
jgi:hypothetical protein